MNKMNPRIKKLWIDTLKSDTIKQGKKRLCVFDKQTNEYQFCCLGVLCEIYNSEMKRLHKKQLDITSDLYEKDDNGENKILFSYNEECAILPKEVEKWSGLPDGYATYGFGLHNQSLTYQNDNGASFKEIAKIIKKEF